jgi:hypothetical protein
MRKLHFLKLAVLLFAASIVVVGSSFDASATKKCITIGQKSVCFDDGKGNKNTDGDNAGENGDNGGGGNQGGGGEQGGGQGNNNTAKPFDCSKAQCDAGEVTLDKPNKYGACCEPKEGFCPPDRPSGTPPNCCPEDTTFREGFCRPTNCPPGSVGTPPHCQRTCGEGKVLVDQTCYDPCPPGTIGTPPSCRCPDGQIWDDSAKACKERPKCTGDMVGTPPNCQCPAKTVLKNGTCQECEGGRVAIKGKCACPKGTIAWPQDASDCVKGTRVVCTWRGTAPGCDGSCEAGEEYGGASSSASGEDWTGGGRIPGGFGSKCWSGSKFYCCHPQ